MRHPSPLAAAGAATGLNHVAHRVGHFHTGHSVLAGVGVAVLLGVMLVLLVGLAVIAYARPLGAPQQTPHDCDGALQVAGQVSPGDG